MKKISITQLLFLLTSYGFEIDSVQKIIGFPPRIEAEKQKKLEKETKQILEQIRKEGYQVQLQSF